MRRGPTGASAIVQRSVAAVVVGYVVAVLSGVLLSFALPMPRFEAVTTAMLLSFVIYLVAILWAFAARTLWRMWLGLLVPGLLCGLLSWLWWPGGGA
jgi:hypothetical protein